MQSSSAVELPDYRDVIANRDANLAAIRSDPKLLLASVVYYRTHPADFIDDWLWTYDPRRTDGPANMPFVLWPRQREYIAWLQERLATKTGGLVEKSRDMGVTYLNLAFTLWLWLFFPGSKVSFGSRKEALVDRIGDPDSIFEKARMILRALPEELLPKGYNEGTDATFAKIVNRQNGATITGEAGDNIGRGGRSLLYMVDEAQPLWAKILTPTGWQTMADMRVGSRVIGPDGHSRTVVGTNDAGVHPLYRLTFSDGTSAVCSPNHLWTVNKVWGGRTRMTLTAREIAESFVYHSPGGQTQYRYRLPRSAPVEFDRPSPLPLHPYLVGALIGDGCLAKSHSSVTFTSADAEIVDRLRFVVPDGYVVKHTVRYDYRLSHPDGRGRVRGHHSRALLNALEDIGLRGQRSWEKHVPQRYLLATPSERLDLLRGLMDTDGSGSGGAATFHSTSQQLAEDVQFLVRSLGGMATYAVKRDHRGYRDIHYVYVAMPEGVSPFYLSRKARAASWARKYAFEKSIVGVAILPPEPVRCITVDADDGLYVTDGFAVTHNSAFVERPERVDAALSQNTDVRIDVSTPNGNGNPFYRKRMSGKVPVFTFHWRDDPRKNEAWYEKMKRELDPVIVASEIDIDYNASTEDVCIPASFVQAALGLASNDKLPEDFRSRLSEGSCRMGLDVADEGGDLNAIVATRGVRVFYLDGWKEGTTTQTTRRANEKARELEVELVRYDKVGVGAGVKGEYAELKLRGGAVDFEAINTGDSPPQGRCEETGKLNSDRYLNLRAWLWWSMRRRFLRTYEHVNGIREYDPDQLIALPTQAECPRVMDLVAELSRPKAFFSETGKIQIEAKKKMTGASPNFADALLMGFVPPKAVNLRSHIVIGRVRR